MTGTSAPGDGTFNMSGGTLNVTATADGDFRVGSGSSSTGTFNMSSGTLNNSNRMRVGFGGTSTGTFLMTKGTVNTRDLEIGRNNTAQGEFIARDGTLNVTNRFVILGNGAAGVSGVFTKYGASNVVFDLANAPAGDGWWVGWGSGTGHGTFRAVIDSTGFTPIDFNQGDLVLQRNGATSVLQVGLDGGVMLSGTNSFNLVNMGTGTVTGNWTTTPDQLWTQSTTTGGVSVTLDTNYLRGTLDAATIGNTINLATVSPIGYITLANVDTVNPLLLRLGIDADSIGASNLDDFIFDLATAGYSPLAFGDYAVDITFDPLTNSAGYFAWDLSGYTSSSALQIESITVIPEPRAALLGGLGLLMLLRRRRA